jgi:stage V sporulation protein B
MPRLSTFWVSGERENFSLNLNRLITVTLLISVPASLAFYLYSFDLLDVLFSVNSSAVGAEMLICLSLGVCSLTLLTVMNTALESQGRVGVTVFSLLIGAATKFAVSYLLIGVSGLGILGAPIGTVISYTVSLIISFCALEITGIRTRALRICAKDYLIGLVCFLPPYKLIYSSGAIASSFWSMTVSLAVSGVLYLMVLGVSYLFFSRDKCLMCTKKHTSGYKNGRFFEKCDEKRCNY